MQSEQPITSVPIAVGLDTRVLQVVGVAEGDFLKQGGAQTRFSSRVDPAGHIPMTATRAGDGGATAPGVVATISFRTLVPTDASRIPLLTAAPVGSGGRSVPAPLPPAHTCRHLPLRGLYPDRFAGDARYSRRACHRDDSGRAGRGATRQGTGITLGTGTDVLKLGAGLDPATTQRARRLRVPEGRPRPAAHPTGQPRRRISAASLAAHLHLNAPSCGARLVNMYWPAAYKAFPKAAVRQNGSARTIATYRWGAF